MTHTIMSWTSWVFALAKNWLLFVLMPVYRHCVASNTALQSSPPPCLPSSPATTPSSLPEKNHRPSSPITTVVVCPPHRPGQTPTCSPQVLENFMLRAQGAYYGLRVTSNRALQSPPASDTSSSSSFFSCTSFSLATTPSSSLERVLPPTELLASIYNRVRGMVDSSSWQSISDGNSASSSSSSSNATTPRAATTKELLQEDGKNQSYEYPPPFHQILVEPGLGKVLLAADLASLLTMVVSLDKNESLGLLGRVVCLLLLLSSLLLFFALLMKEIYPLIAMVTALLGIGWSIAAASAYPLNLYLPHLPVTVLSPIVALSIMTSIMIIFCFKKYERERF